MPERIRAKRVPSPDGGHEVVIYLEAAVPQAAAYMPMTNAVTLINDLRLAIMGEVVDTKEKALGPGHQDQARGGGSAA